MWAGVRPRLSRRVATTAARSSRRVWPVGGMAGGMPVGATACGDKLTPIVQVLPAARQGPRQNPVLPGCGFKSRLASCDRCETLGGNRDAVLSCGSCGRGPLSRRCVIAGCDTEDGTGREIDSGCEVVETDDQDPLREWHMGVGLLPMVWTRRLADFADGVGVAQRGNAASRVGVDRGED